jgi:pre-mRNA-processing factor 40
MQYEMTHKTTLDEFTSLMKADKRTDSMDPHTIRAVFEKLREKVLRRHDEDRHLQRRAIDALRHRIRHLEPPVGLNDTWEQVRPRVEKTEEYRALEDEDLCRQAFDRVIRRLKEQKDEDDHHHRSSRDSRDHRPRERDGRRENARGSRYRERSPEIDAYAADRKKAQADRERNYRRGSNQLSPQGSEGTRGDTDRYEPPARGTDHYDGRRERDRGDRERGYISRADPRDRGSGALDYGEEPEDGVPLSAGAVSASGAFRRRRESEGEGGREAKVSLLILCTNRD